MNARVLTLRRLLARNDGVNVHSLALSGLCATVLLGTYVHTLNAAVERQALRERKPHVVAQTKAPAMPTDASARDLRVGSIR